MDGTVGDAAIFGLISSVITAIIEIIKAWVPSKYKDEAGLIVPYGKNGRHAHLPNQAVWPLLSLVLGIGIFFALNYDPLYELIGGQPGDGMAVSGAATGLFSQGVYRVKNVLGTRMGGTPETNAQNTGPQTVAAAPPTTNDDANH